ncbi:MAG: fluoride efflux transporter CrcB [Methylococcales symbiont of Hymedesmia sp. n. MRB-2018]|nr:MAG: fluoride efflux transporter CrcB [Methylococcales symbiont of Hymedesmia sp. n. MRB-2018]KAF3984052.1 MAG: fluoride efflux transporter CrcB [Methylococcales symbiont of Hymedesmia sp. n. MRB-2018]
MNQIIAVALGGAFGAVFRFLIATGIYQWLGRGFPYGTLTVNIIGSFLLGLMTEALLLQRVALSMEYRSAILIGLFGSLTTFSTFSLDTLYLIEQGQISKASLNIVLNVFVCILAVWIGLAITKTLFLYADGSLPLMGGHYPYALLVINFLGAFLIACVSAILLTKTNLALACSTSISVILIAIFITLSSLYLVLYFVEQGHTFESHFKAMTISLISNIIFCSIALWMGRLISKQI